MFSTHLTPLPKAASNINHNGEVGEAAVAVAAASESSRGFPLVHLSVEVAH